MATATAWIAAYNAQDFDALGELASDDLRVEDPATGNHLVGWPAFRRAAEEIARHYPDRRITVSRMMPLGESAVAIEGEWQGRPVDGPRTGEDGLVRYVESMVVELVAGKIAYRRIYR
jgi:steroid delta-isomerase-like uncharacterized protein